jgi:hypothetical protein
MLVWFQVFFRCSVKYRAGALSHAVLSTVDITQSEAMPFILLESFDFGFTLITLQQYVVVILVSSL